MYRLGVKVFVVFNKYKDQIKILVEEGKYYQNH